MNNKQKHIDENRLDKRFFRMLYILFAISSICFAARVLLTTTVAGNDAVIGIIITIIFVALAGFFVYTAFWRKQGFENSKLMIRLEYAAFGLIILQLILSFTDI